jgi:hypothetical protein
MVEQRDILGRAASGHEEQVATGDDSGPGEHIDLGLTLWRSRQPEANNVPRSSCQR